MWMERDPNLTHFSDQTVKFAQLLGPARWGPQKLRSDLPQIICGTLQPKPHGSN